MRELGLHLREKRESAGLDLEAIHAKTKIRKRYLIALEEGDWSVLPGEVYARGFVRSYAEALGLDGLQLLATYVDQTPHASKNPADEPFNGRPSVQEHSSNQPARHDGVISDAQTRRKQVSPKVGQAGTKNPGSRLPQTKFFSNRRFTGASQVAVVVGVLVVIAGGWLLLKNNGNATASAPNTLSNSVVAKNATIEGNVTGTNSIANSLGNATSNGATSGTSNPPTTQITTGPFQNLQQTYTVATSQPLTINLTAMNQDCWIKVTVDGTVVDPNDTLLSGQTKAWTANQSATIRLGHVTGMTLQINGQQVVLPSTQNAIDVVIQKSST